MSCSDMNRREFVEMTTASIAGGVLGLGGAAAADEAAVQWDPDRSYVSTGKKLPRS